MLEIFPVKTDEDIEIARELFAECDGFLQEQLSEYDSFSWMAKHWQNCKEEVSGLPGKYSEPHGCILVANYKNKPAGCVGLLAESSEISIMKRLYVRPEFRGFGIGKDLVRTITEHACKKDYESIQLHTYSLLNPAINLYKSLGFEEVSHNRKYPEEIKDLIVHMELKLK